MTTTSDQGNAPFNTKFFPQHVTLLTVGENMMPMGYWTVISKDPFRFLICMQMGNHTYTLMQRYQEAALHFMPWSARETVARAGHISGRDGGKATRLGLNLLPAEKLEHTKLVKGAESVYETVVYKELPGLSREFAIYALDVVAVHGPKGKHNPDPILYLSQKDFATIGERWRYRR